jgi:SRSO17 transposase
VAQAVPGPSAQRLQEVLTTRPWDAEDRNRQQVQPLVAEATVGAGGVGRDDPGFPKPGKAAVGMARPYAGMLGKVGPGQLAVPLAVQVDLPQAGAGAPARQRPARSPAGGPFQPKPESALTRLEPARAWGVPHRGVVAAADRFIELCSQRI